MTNMAPKRSKPNFHISIPKSEVVRTASLTAFRTNLQSRSTGKESPSSPSALLKEYKTHLADGYTHRVLSISHAQSTKPEDQKLEEIRAAITYQKKQHSWAPYDDAEAYGRELSKAWELDWWEKYDAEEKRKRNLEDLEWEKRVREPVCSDWGTPRDVKPLSWSSGLFEWSAFESDGPVLSAEAADHSQREDPTSGKEESSPEVKLRGGGKPEEPSPAPMKSFRKRVSGFVHRHRRNKSEASIDGGAALRGDRSEVEDNSLPALERVPRRATGDGDGEREMTLSSISEGQKENPDAPRGCLPTDPRRKVEEARDKLGYVDGMLQMWREYGGEERDI